MKVEEFIEEYNNATNKGEYLNNHILSYKYVPYVLKMVKCENINKSTMYKTINDKKVFCQNTPMKYMIFNMVLIDTYTDIDVDFTDGKIMECYDLLEELGLVTELLDLIPESEHSAFDLILSMQTSDIIANTRELSSFIENKLDASGIFADIIQNLLTANDENKQD